MEPSTRYLIYASKSIRNFYNGMISSCLIYYFFYCANYYEPINISLMIFAAVLSGIIKSKIITSLTKRRGEIINVIITYLFYLGPLDYYCMPNGWQGIILIKMIVVGFFPVDGEEIILFEQVEENHLYYYTNQQASKSLQMYSKLGYIFQAFGSLSSFLYMSFRVQESFYHQQRRMRQLLYTTYYIAFINLAFYTYFQLNKRSRPDHPSEVESQVQLISHDFFQSKKLKILSLVDGFSIGLLPAPFLAYYLDLKLNFYYNQLGLLLFAFFFLKGLGQECMLRYPKWELLFKRWSLISNILLVVIALIPERRLSVVCFILSFPMWNYCKTLRRKYLCTFSNNVAEINSMNQDLTYWERSGAAIGILVSSFTFSILYYQPYFGYSIFLCGVFRQISSSLISGTLFKSQNGADLAQASSENQVKIRQFQMQEQMNQENRVQYSRREHIGQKATKRHFVYGLLAISFFYTLYYVYVTSCFYQNTCQPLRVKSEKIAYSPSLKLFNESLAHFLVRQNKTNVKLINCNEACLEQHRNRRENYYSQLKYDSATPEWLHFPEMSYFGTKQEVEDELGSFLLQNPSAKGFSLFWSHPLLYNKMASGIEGFVLALPEKYGFYYAEMASLNLRGVQNQIVMIFTREIRKPVQLPPFVKKQPPKNYLGTQTTFKMVSNYLYLREYILYHLNLGVDKFFLYNNDRDYSDPTFYQEYRGVGKFLQRCFNATFDEQYAYFEQIWQQFYDHIIYIPYRVGDYYPQEEAFVHYGYFYRNVVTFTSFTDIDQFIFSPSGKYLPDTLQELLGRDHVTAVIITSRNFKSRVCLDKQLAIEQSKWLHQPTFRLTIKSILLTKCVTDHTVHHKSIKNGRPAGIGDARHDFSMIHFKITSTYEGFGSDPAFSTDNAMQAYVEALKEACQGKCSHTLNLTCSKQQHEQMMQEFCRG